MLEKTQRTWNPLFPDDIAVIGFNNDVIRQIVEPELTTIDYPGFFEGGSGFQVD
ncbi:MAG: LacI family DNA-binding transcriptional regulator [Saprospiraceae bacterium]|nr:LacI family DNA-binding transcriptional regulator [Saprospiraceae bacterium]